MIVGPAAWPSPRGERAIELYKRVNEAYGPAMQRHGMVVGLSISVVQVAIYAGGAAILGRQLTLIEFILPMLLAAGVMAVVFRRRLRDRISTVGPSLVSAITQDGLCATCLYQLGGLVPEADGCLVCPECGSAWRAERVKNAEPFLEHQSGMDAARLVLRHMDGTILVSNFQDDRGRACPLVHPWMRRAIRSADTPELKDRIRQARRQVLMNRLWLRVPIAIIFGLFGVGTIAIVLWARPAGALRITTLPGILVGVLSMLGLAVWVIFGRFGYGGAQVASILLKHRLCPACAADLADAKADPDGCAVCPDCARAWRAGRMQTC